MNYTFQLCAARHPIPGNPPALFPTSVNPLDVAGLAASAAAAIPADCTDLTVYVTGLTVAMLAVVTVCVDRGITLTALHHDRESGQYYPQQITQYHTCGFCGGRYPAGARCCTHCGAT